MSDLPGMDKPLFEPQPRIREVHRRQRTLLERLVRESPMGIVGVALLFMIILAALAAPWLAPFDPLEHVGRRLATPGGDFVLGTDEFGRDILSRIIYGARTALVVGVLAVSIGATIGVPAGLLAGYYGGWVDTTIMRLWDVLLAFPVILIAIFMLALLGPSTLNLSFVLAAGQMPIFARLMRSVVLKERELDYVSAATLSGANDRRIIFREILPNCVPPLLVQLSLAMAAAVLLEAGLSFIGLGAQPPTPTWGGMLSASRTFLRAAPWYAIAPGVAIGLLVFSLTYMSDALGQLTTPKGQEGGR